MASIKKSGRKLLSEAELRKVLEAMNDDYCGTIWQFMEAGWDVNQQLNKDRETPLHQAACRGSTEVARVLLQCGAHVDMPDKDGITPLHWAALLGHTQIVKCLVEHSATVNVTSKEGVTPLHCAAGCGHTQTVECLVEHSATVNVRDEDGRTPLHRAAQWGHTAVVQCLLQHGANVNVRNKDGKTAYDVCGKEAIKNLLKKHMKQTPRSKKMNRSVECAEEMRPRVPEGATAGSPDQRLGASATPSEKQFSSMLERYAYSKGKTIPDSEAEVSFTVKRRNDSDLDILKLVIRQSDYFPLIQSPTQLTGSTTQFHAPGKNVMSAELHKSLAVELQSVVLLAKADGTGVGSGFRVGPTYVMTNCHVLKGLSHEPKDNVAVFNFDKPRRMDGVGAAPIRAILAHCEDLDVAVLDLDFDAVLPIAFNECQRINKFSLPSPVTDFATIDAQEYIHFVGHPTGDGKVLDTQCTIDRTCTSPHNREKLLGLHRKYNNDVFKKIADRRRALYQSSEKFGNGSSGSPGFVADHQKRACVAVMHSCGHFIRVAPGEFHLDAIEQGVRMECVYEFLLHNYAELCTDIFRGRKPARVV